MNKVKWSLLLIIMVFSTVLKAQSNVRDRQKEEKIEEQLKTIDPSLVPLFKEATNALDQQNYKVADSLYSIVYLKAPEFDPLLRRLGSLKIASGSITPGLALCRKAVQINRSAYNLYALASGYIVKSDSTDLHKAQSLLEETLDMPNGDELDILANYVDVSMQLNDIESARTGVNIMRLKHPDEMLTHYFNAIILITAEKWKEARKEVLIAQEKGLPQEEVDRLLDSGINQAMNKTDAIFYFAIIVGIWMGGLLLLFLIGKLFSKLTINAIENKHLDSSAAKSGGWLRSGYRALINLAGFYYYISLPILLVLIIVLTLGILYLFIIAGTIPIKISLILIFAAGASIYGMVRSLLVKVEYTDPGRELKVEEADGLYELTTEVANIMGTRPIDEIRITPYNDLAVYEKGKWREKLKDKGRRVLILGTSVLRDFKTNDFKAVLAHEYGHFAHRDTAGGDVAIRVKNDMNKYFYALYKAGQNTVWNIAFHFLRLYNFIFRRISHGATRLQEVLADKVAAETFGAKSFENGLTHVIKREIEFVKSANIEIEEAIKLKRSLNNLYELTMLNDSQIEEELSKALNSKTSEDDTHPSPSDRFRYIKDIVSSNNSNEDSLITDLFKNWKGITDEMTVLIDAKVEKN